jgi:uncharacterized protein
VTTLLDVNVLIALLVREHVHHQAAESFFGEGSEPFATCPITQTSLLRFLLREGRGGADALEILRAVTSHARHVFWPDDLPAHAVTQTALTGHRQVTDAYLAALARHHGGRVATFDRGLAAVHADVGHLLTLDALER